MQVTLTRTASTLTLPGSIQLNEEVDFCIYLCCALLEALCQAQQLFNASHCNLPLQACLRISVGHKDRRRQILHRDWDGGWPSMTAQWHVATIDNVVSQEAHAEDWWRGDESLQLASSVNVCAPLQGQNRPEQSVSEHVRVASLSALV